MVYGVLICAAVNGQLIKTQRDGWGIKWYLTFIAWHVTNIFSHSGRQKQNVSPNIYEELNTHISILTTSLKNWESKLSYLVSSIWSIMWLFDIYYIRIGIIFTLFSRPVDIIILSLVPTWCKNHGTMWNATRFYNFVEYMLFDFIRKHVWYNALNGLLCWSPVAHMVFDFWIKFIQVLFVWRKVYGLQYLVR